MTSPVDHSGQLLGGRYRLRRQLGAGGMGVVYEAWQEDLGRSVAVKLMTGADQESLLRFQREARTAASLGHPHIVQIFDFQTQPHEPPFIVMELVAGSSLSQLLKSVGLLDEDRAARIGVQVLSALDAAHRAGILHRDVKPANVLVTTSPTMGEIAKVLDFGIAKVNDAQAAPITQYGSVIGTLAYMSPEQARGEPLDGRSDIYSLATTLFFACTGERAIDAPQPGLMFRALVGGQVRRLATVRPGLDPVFCAIVERGLAPDRDARFGSAQEMADALTQWLESRGTAGGLRSSSASLDFRSSQPGPALSQSQSALSQSHPALSQPALPQSNPAFSHAPTGSYGVEATATAAPTHATATAHIVPPQPPAKKGSALFLGMGVLGGLALVGAVAAAAAAGGYYYFYYDAEQSPAAAGTTPAGARPAAAGAAATDPAVGSQTPSSGTTRRTSTGAAKGTAPQTSTASPTTPASPTSPTAPAAEPATTATATATTTAPADPTPAPKAKTGLIGSACESHGDCLGVGRCTGGTCSCSAHDCNGICVNTSTDANNCGACGKKCGSGILCMYGNCNPCNYGFYAQCNGVCVNTGMDFNNCGACGKKCKPGKTCKMGKCDE